MPVPECLVLDPWWADDETVSSSVRVSERFVDCSLLPVPGWNNDEAAVTSVPVLKYPFPVFFGGGG